MVCFIHRRNIGPISSTIPSPLIQPLHKDRSHMRWMFQRAGVPWKRLRLNYVRYIPRPQGLSHPHEKYWAHQSNIQYYTISLNPALSQRQVCYMMNDSKCYCTRKKATSQSRTDHSKNHGVCPIATRNIWPIGPISSTMPSPWIQHLPKGRSDMTWMI